MTYMLLVTSILLIGVSVCCMILALELIKARKENIELEDKAAKYYLRLLGQASGKDA